MILDYRSLEAPNTHELPFSVSSFYNRGFTIGHITDRPRKVYHQWKAEGLIPSHFGKDYWLNYQHDLGVKLEDKSWERFNFVEAAWIKLVDILREHNYPKAKIKRMAEIYFGIDEERKRQFQAIMKEYKNGVGKKLESLLIHLGTPHDIQQVHDQLRDISGSFTMGRFDQMTFQSIYEREPLIFIASKEGGLIPVIEGEKAEDEKHEAFIDEIKSKPHLIIPYYKIIESMLFDEEYAHYTKSITGLDLNEAKIIKAIRENKIREITVTKSDDRKKIVLRQTERQIIGKDEEARLIKLFTNRKYRVTNISHIEGDRILIDFELKETIQAKA